MPQKSLSRSVEKSVFEVEISANDDLRFKEYNMSPSVIISEHGDHKNYRWEFANMEAMETESRMPRLRDIVPFVRIAPSDFKYDDYEGNMSDWDSFAQFINSLNEGRNELSEATKVKIRELVKDEVSDTEKIKAIYKYLQENTRYISVQLGIGGWQPFTAEFVDEMGYGDCKALSNYMKSLLEAVDIPSIYTLVLALPDMPNIDTSFPHNQFNHAILCVPNHGDTIWLECTSQDNPFGYASDHTGDRDVLLCTRDGGKIVHTPVYAEEENVLNTNSKVEISESGDARANAKISFKGLQYDDIAGLSDIGLEKQKKALYNLLDIPNFEIGEFKVLEHKDRIPMAELDVELALRRFASASGKRIFFKPNLLNRYSKQSQITKERKFPLKLNFAYTDVDTLIYDVPESYHLEFSPEPIELESEFGSYFSNIIVEQGKVVYVRKIVMKKGIWPPESYKSYIDYINKIAEADNMNIVLVKST
jgi:hypothetical protein